MSDYSDYTRKDRKEILRKEAMVVVPKEPIHGCPCCGGTLTVWEAWEKSRCNHPVDTIYRAYWICDPCNVKILPIYPHYDLDTYEKFKKKQDQSILNGENTKENLLFLDLEEIVDKIRAIEESK